MDILHEVMHLASAPQDLKLNFQYENENGHTLHSCLVVLPETMCISIYMYYMHFTGCKFGLWSRISVQPVWDAGNLHKVLHLAVADTHGRESKFSSKIKLDRHPGSNLLSVTSLHVFVHMSYMSMRIVSVRSTSTSSSASSLYEAPLNKSFLSPSTRSTFLHANTRQ